MNNMGAIPDGYLLIKRDDAEFVLAALAHFGEWGYSPLDFERVRQARNVLVRGLVTPEGEAANLDGSPSAKVPR